MLNHLINHPLVLFGGELLGDWWLVSLKEIFLYEGSLRHRSEVVLSISPLMNLTSAPSRIGGTWCHLLPTRCIIVKSAARILGILAKVAIMRLTDRSSYGIFALFGRGLEKTLTIVV